MATPFIAEIRIFPYNFAPRGWAFCNGQIMSISQNTALFSLLGTTYGGNGSTNFGLPNLQGRAPLGFGQGAGLSAYALGQTGGQNTVTLQTTQIPSHTHTVNANNTVGNQINPAGNVWAQGGAGRNEKLYSSSAPNASMNPGAVQFIGGSQPHTNLQPYLVFNFCIALTGIYPARN